MDWCMMELNNNNNNKNEGSYKSMENFLKRKHNIHSKAFVKCLRGRKSEESKQKNRISEWNEFWKHNSKRLASFHRAQKIMRLISFSQQKLVYFLHILYSLPDHHLYWRAKWWWRCLQAFRIQTPCLTSIRMIGFGSKKKKKTLIYTYTLMNLHTHTHTMHSHSNKRR